MPSHAQLLGSHRLAVAPSLQVFADGQRLLFNAGENVQRFHLEHKLHLARVSDVFLTSLSSSTVGGLLGLLLSIEGAGREGDPLRLWAPPHIRAFIDAAAKSFAGLRYLDLEFRTPPFPEPRAGRSSLPAASSSAGSSASECVAETLSSGVSVEAFLLPHSRSHRVRDSQRIQQTLRRLFSGQKPHWETDSEDEAHRENGEDSGLENLHDGSEGEGGFNPLLEEVPGDSEMKSLEANGELPANDAEASRADARDGTGESERKKKRISPRATERSPLPTDAIGAPPCSLEFPSSACSTVSSSSLPPASPFRSCGEAHHPVEKQSAKELTFFKWHGESPDEPCDCVAYVLKWPLLPGKFFPEKAKALKVPVGPLFGRLKNGESVEIPGEAGRVVTPAEVCGPGQPGQTAVVLQCVEPQQATFALNHLNVDLSCLTFVFHMTAPSILRSPEYKRLVQGLSGQCTRHVLCNQCDSGVAASPFVHATKLRQFLQDIMPPIFPFSSSPVALPPLTYASDSEASSLTLSRLWELEDSAVVQPNGLVKFDLSAFEKREIDASAELTAFRPRFSDARLERVRALAQTRTRCRSILARRREAPGLSSIASSSESCSPASSDERVSLAIPPASPASLLSRASLPAVILLGTGAAAPSQYRNVSGLLLAIRSDLSFVLDFGEGSLAQLFSMSQSWTEFHELLRSIRLIFISHCHADHHLGVCSLLEVRAAICPCEAPPVVIAPARLQPWLCFFDRHVTRIPHTFRSSDTIAVDASAERQQHGDKAEAGDCSFSAAQFLGADASDVTLRATPVEHIPQAYGVRVDFKALGADQASVGDFSVVYSGDTRPCQRLFDLARNATVLIHEATFEDTLIQEAIEKRHSSLSEVVRGALDCRCANLVLTHFSQRYPKIPVLTVEDGTEAFVMGEESPGATAAMPHSTEAEAGAPGAGKAPLTVFSQQKCEDGKNPMHILFAFDCMRLPLNDLEELSQCLKLLPPVINELFVTE
ncbi:putative ribonuclease z [Besnoitia besnoiti]|uniref:ribonuclease Z n=1 Tax=Besnoitia besnoiti TaxID=94643 RepID=A0A2A9MLN6_BESBE|nr:putative ribonuclease z [Besnoitia besnoiti]PFH37251.1 putative ribonuclease z [Besnoitia besnoiti]